jgi:hypothetical protein
MAPPGSPAPQLGRALKVKPVTDPAVRKFTDAAMIDITRNGLGKM